MRSTARPRHLLGFGVAAALCAAAMNPPPARAADTWLMPTRYRAGLTDTISVSCWTGDGFRGRPVPWHRPRVHAFRLVGFRDLDIAGACADGDTTWARFAPVDEEGELVGVETNWLTTNRAPAWLRAEVPRLGGRVAPAPAAPTRVRERQCAKTWLPGAGGTRYTHALGTSLELVPLDDPARDGELRVRLLSAGQPVAGAPLRAWRQPEGPDDLPLSPAARDSLPPVVQTRTNAAGEATLELKGRGEFLLAAGLVRACADTSAAALEILRATFTFARPGTPGPSGSR